MPKLDNIKGENPFKIPENYFEDLSRDLETKMIETKLIEKFGKKTPFNVPKEYFPLLEYRLTSISNKNKITSKILLIKPYLMAAAIIIVMLGIWKIFLQDINFNTQQFIAKTDTVKNQDSITENDFDFDDVIYYETSEISNSKEAKVDLNSTDKKELEEYITDNVDESIILAEL